MANWKYVLDVKDIWNKFDNNAITPYEAGKLMLEKLYDLYNVLEADGAAARYDLNDIATDFEFIDGDFTVEDFNYILQDLYYWADRDHVCWIETF